MALFQKAASTPEEVARDVPLELSPVEVAEMDEETWYAEAYRGDDVPQLTVRAVLMGTALGFLLAFTNVYIGLKTGWHLGVAITACILSYSAWAALLKVGIAKTPMSILENNCMQSTASAAGYSTGGTMVSAIPALLMLSATPANPGGTHLPWAVLAGWTALLATLGVCLAIPMKRNMINQERLKFPSGMAAATTLQSLYASGTEASQKAKALLFSALFGGAFPAVLELEIMSTTAADGTVTRGPLLTPPAALFDFLPGAGVDRTTGEAFTPSSWTVLWDWNPVMIAAGAIVGLRVTVWMLIGAVVLAWVVGPLGYEAAWTNANGDLVYATTAPHKAWKEIGLWVGAPMMVASGLLSFAFQWRTIGRALRGLGGSSGGAHSDVEVPGSWFVGGVLVSGAGVVLLAWGWFEVPPLLGIVAVILTFFLALVAARATGESDITPTGAMGKIMQLVYGVLIPQSATANLMTAGVTAGAAGACADLLNDLKSGYLLGADPRRQFVAQAIGILSGTVATVTGFYLLIPDATALTGVGNTPPVFPAPAAQAWKAVAEVFVLGFQNMHPMHQSAILVGLIIGGLAVSAEQFASKEVKRFLPSATGLGLGFILPFQYPLSMLVGAVIAAVWSRADAKSAEDYVIPLASGVIAGVSIIGVLVACLNNFVL